MVRDRGLTFQYGSHREMFVANKEEYDELIGKMDELSPDDDLQLMSDVPIELHLGAISLRRDEIKLKREENSHRRDIDMAERGISERVLDLLSCDKVNFNQAMELVNAMNRK